MKRIVQFITIILSSIALMIVVSYAWYTNAEFVEPNLSGYSTDAYFGGGDGSPEMPFIIKNPRHLYNLAWLQYLDYFNKPVSEDPDAPHAPDGTITQYSFVIIRDLDMSGYVLPPIGTTIRPFIGNINGRGYTISNLTTSNKFSDFGDKHPSTVTPTNFANCESIGLFGCIGQTSTMEDEDSSLTLNESYNGITNIYLDSCTVDTYGQTLVGAVSGYVNGSVTNIAVRQPNIKVNNNAAYEALHSMGGKVSNYTLVGYAEDEYTTLKSKRATTIYNPTTTYSHFNYNGMGNANEWGGSMNMTDLYSRYRSAVTSSYATTDGSGYNFDYVYQEIKRSDGTIKQATQSSSNAVYGSYYTPRRYMNTSNYENGIYYMSRRSDTNGPNVTEYASGRFNYVSAIYKDLYTITEGNTTLTAYKIHDGNGNYLYYDQENNEFENIRNAEEAALWILDNGRLYTYNEEVYSTNIEYSLNGTTSLTRNLSTTSTTTWSWDTNHNTFKYTYDGIEYYLKFTYEGWSVTPTYVISDGNGNYLKYDSSISNVTDIEDASLWIFSNDGQNPDGTIRLSNNGYYLRYSNMALDVSNTNSNNVWANQSNQLYVVNGNSSYYLQFDTTDSAWKLVTPTTYYIQYNGNYLYLNNSGTIQTSGTTNINNASKFNFTDTLNTIGGTGKIYVTIDNNSYYLRYNNGLVRTTNQNDSNTTWSHDSYGLYINVSNTKYYLQFKNNTWQLSSTIEQKIIGFYISYGNNYLTHNNTTITNATSQANATVWYFTNPDTSNPSGFIYTIINGTEYYLNCPTTSGNYIVQLTLSTTPVTFTNSGGYLKDESTNCYVIYYSNNNNYWWSYANTYNRQTFTAAYGPDYDNTPLANYTATNVNNLSISNEILNLSSTSFLMKELKSIKTTPASVFNYIPLNASKTNPYTVDNKNTGYIIGGGHETVSNGQKSDIRISQYFINNISRDYNGNNYTASISSSGSGNTMTFNSFAANKIYTVDGNTNNNVHTINDTTNTYIKYKQSKETLSQTLVSSGANLYGLHFMDASISKDNLITAPKVIVNGKTFNNYQMPEDCIDFQLASKGYINFFAGTYYPDNDSFFSLHQIIRDDTDANDDGIPDNPVILDIKHISKIYKANTNYGLDYKSADYVYQYTDNSYSIDSFVSSKYDLVFRKEWIEEPGTPANIGYKAVEGYNSTSYYGRVFYFEIPVNKGEFALGSVSGKTGAYLFYLDIGANAAPVDRTEITQQTTTVVEDYRYVNGIQLIQTIPASQADPSTHQNTVTVDASNTLVTYINTSVTQNITLTRTGDNAISSNVALNSSYIADTVTSHTNIELTPLGSNTSTIKVLKYRDFNKATDRMYETTVICDGSDGTNNTSYSTYRLVLDANGNITDKILMANQNTSVTDAVKAEYGLLKIETVNNVLVGKGVITDDDLNDGYEYKDYVTITPSTSSEILSYNMTVLTTNKNSITEVISLFDDQVMENSKPKNVGSDIIRITGNTTINGYTITGGSYEFTNEDPTYTMDHIYRLATEFVTITSGESNMIIKITAVAANDGNANNTYTFTINGTTVTAVNQQITVNAT